MQRVTRPIAARIWFLLALAVLAGLSTVPAAAAKAPVTLQYWHAYSGRIGDMHEQLVAEFNRTHADVQVSSVFGGSLWTMRDKLVAALTAGAGPDVANIDQFWLPELASGGYVVLLEDLFAATPNFDVGDVFPEHWETARYRGKVWAMPFAVSNVVLYYNRGLLDFLGASEEDVPRTWRELVAFGARALDEAKKTKGRGPLWVLDVPTTAQTGVVYYFIITLWQRGGELFAPDLARVAFDSQEGVETLAFWQELVRAGIIDLKRPDRVFESGRAILQLASCAHMRATYAELPFEFGVAPLPADRFRATGIGGRSLVILADDDAARQQAAWSFVQWMTASDTSRRWSEATGYIPLRRSTYSSEAYQRLLADDPRLQVPIDEMRWARHRPNIAAYDEISRILGEAVEAALYRQSDPAAVLGTAAEKANAVLRRHQSQGR